jgi:hypothetical protein
MLAGSPNRTEEGGCLACGVHTAFDAAEGIILGGQHIGEAMARAARQRTVEVCGLV